MDGGRKSNQVANCSLGLIRTVDVDRNRDERESLIDQKCATGIKEFRHERLVTVFTSMRAHDPTFRLDLGAAIQFVGGAKRCPRE
jgi:hypothetical protein